jgi:hypothetical protein
MFRSFPAGPLRLGSYQADWDAEDLLAGYNSEYDDVNSYEPVLYFPLDPVAPT